MGGDLTLPLLGLCRAVRRGLAVTFAKQFQKFCDFSVAMPYLLLGAIVLCSSDWLAWRKTKEVHYFDLVESVVPPTLRLTPRKSFCFACIESTNLDARLAKSPSYG